MINESIKRILVELQSQNGSTHIMDIKDLDREEYEQFLETIHALRLSYITLMRKPDNGDERD